MGFSFSNKLFGGTGSGGSSSPLTTKGDVYTNDGTDDARLAVAADGLVLTCDAASTTGLKWAAGPAPAAAGADTQVLFNDGGALAGDAGMTYDKTGNSLGLTGPLVVTPLADIQAAVLRRFGAAQAQKILLVQTELNAELASIAADGSADFTSLTLDNPLAVTEGGTGLATFGTAGQVLATNATTDGLEWIDAGGGLTSPVGLADGGTGSDLSAVALGGLITGTGAGAVGVKAVGADGTFLKANSGAAGGVEWAAGGGGITNGAGNNVITKSDGTNLVASSISDTGSAITVGTASATPQAFTYRLSASSRPGTDSNVAGASTTLTSGLGTGTGAASRLLLGGPILGSSGSTVQSTATPVSIGGEVKSDGTESFINVTGTLPVGVSAPTSGTNIAITGAGSATGKQYAASISLAAGYTGGYQTAALDVQNNSANNAIYPAANANHGVHALCNGPSAGLNIGVQGWATASTSAGNWGVLGRASFSNATAPSIGVIGMASNGTSPYRAVGGLFTLDATNKPTVASPAALVADNAAVAATIFRALDNGTTVFSVNDGGGVNMMRSVEANTAGSGAPNVLVATESHAVLTNEGSTAANYHTLPTAAAGLTFTFVVQDTDGIRVTANTDDTIRIAATVTAAAGYITNSTIGSTVTLVAINAVEWVAVASHGTWTFGP